MSKKTLIIIAAIAVMLAGATNAYGYYEHWDGWFSSGWIDYNGDRYSWGPSEGGYIHDSTYIYETRDTFYCAKDSVTYILLIHAVNPSGDTIELKIPSDEVTGGKEYGITSIRRGGGFWSGTGYHRDEHGQLVKIFDIWGTWFGTFDYTDYPPNDPTYTAESPSTRSNPLGVRALGYSRGYRSYFSPFEPQP